MITSINNTQIKEVVRLRDKKSLRREKKLFIIEGIRMFREVPPDWIAKLYVSQSFLDRRHGELSPHTHYELVSDQVFTKMSDTKTPQGILALIKQPTYQLEAMLHSPHPFLLVLEDIQDPGNLGTILRSAEAAGVNGIILSQGSADIYNPKVIRATMGSIFRTPFTYSANLQETLRQIHNHQIHIYATHLDSAIDYDHPNYQQAAAILIGNEGNGLTPATAAIADTHIRIPMKGQVESLNASIAASLVMYEVYRQRRQ